MATIVPIDEQRLQKLPASELAGQLMSLPARQRLATILERSDSAAVVAAMTAQDFFLTVKEAPDADALVLLSLATREQLDHIVDLEGWDGDQVQPGRVLHWCATMLAASDRTLLTWLYHADFELLVVLFRQWLELLPAEEDEDDKRNAPTRETIDGVRFFSIRYPDYRDVILFMLRYLFEVHQAFYQELFWTMEAALPSEMEELAYRFHRGRLADNAIPDPDEAHTIYHPLARHRIKTHEKFRDVPHRPPGFALTAISGDGLLAQAISLLPTGRTATIAQELTGLANKVVVADRLAVEDPASLHDAAAKVVATVNLGLELYGGDNPGQAVKTLETVFLEDLFRLAHTAIRKTVAPLHKQAKEGWLARWPHGTAILDPEWSEAVEAALDPTVRLVDGTSDNLVRTSADLNRLAELVETITAAGRLFERLETRFGRFWTTLALWPQGQAPSLEAVTLGAVLLTGTVNLWWRGEWRPEPLPVAAWLEVADLVSAERFAEEVEAVLLAGIEDEFRPAARRYLEPVLRRVTEAVAAWEESAPPDARLIDFLLFRSAP